MPRKRRLPAAKKRIGDRLVDAQRSGFVGREAELALFRSAVAAVRPAFTVLHVHGPGGVGKTTLLHEFARIARDQGRHVVRLDGRDIAPTSGAFLQSLREAAGPKSASADPSASVPPGAVVLIDTYEALSALDAWLRETLLPEWPAPALVVLAGRQPPRVAWTTDVAWSPLTRVLSLGNLEPSEGQAFLRARGVAPARHARVLEFTHGHPLALALVADLLRQRRKPSDFDPLEAPDVVRHLSSLFLESVPDALQREALDVCAVARVTTQPLLTELLGQAAGRSAFEWLRACSFVESGRHGLFPHDLVREVVIADARWRDAAALGRLSRRVSSALHGQIAVARGPERQRLQMDALYVTRIRPTHASFFDWGALERDARGSRGARRLALDLRVRGSPRGAGLGGARESLVARSAVRLSGLCGPGDVRFGWLALLDIGTPAASAPDDPAITAARAFVERHGPLGRGEAAVYLRWWMHADAYQAVSAAINLTAMHVVSHCVTRPGLAWNFVAMADPSFWAPHFDGVNFARVPEADFEVAGRRHGVFAHDWRVEPPEDWIMGARTPMPFAGGVAEPGAAAGLSPAEFARAVRQALRDYTRPAALADGPLRSSRLLRGARDAQARAAALQGLLCAAAEELQTHPRDLKLHRALWLTYFEPLPTQELAAERLGLPFSTYRHHLTRGIERIARSLWQRERALPPS
jgi:hypothetical protein